MLLQRRGEEEGQRRGGEKAQSRDSNLVPALPEPPHLPSPHSISALELFDGQSMHLSISTQILHFLKSS